MIRFLHTLAAICAATLACISGVQAASVSGDTTPFSATSFPGSTAPAVRFRNQNSGGELYVGYDLGSNANRTERGFTYTASAPFSVAFDTVSNTVTGTYGNTVSASRGTPASATEINAIEVSITGPRYFSNGNEPNYFSFTGLTLNGMPLAPSNALIGITPPDRRSTLSFYVWDFAQAPSYTLAGTLNYAGTLGVNGSSEGARAEFRFGSVTPVPLPAAVWLLIAALGGLWSFARRTPA